MAESKSNSRSFYITSAISYPNSSPHIGHLYEYIACDTIARFQRSCSKEVFFIVGTDEHGSKMQQTANRLKIEPYQLAERNVKLFQKMMQVYNGSHDDFIRTTEKRHKEAVLQFWQKLVDNGDIYLGSYKGWYCVREEAFFKEDELVKNSDGTYATQSGAPVQWVTEESYFFRLSKYRKKILEIYNKNPDFVAPKSRFNEIIRFVEKGLDDLSISRVSLDWGIKLVDNPRHSIYVWLDALTAYISVIGYPQLEGKMAKLWPADLHVIGKDILRFHAVYWPAFLLSAGLPLPKKIFSHGFILNRGEKMSKSVGNIIDPFDLCKHYSSDILRYFFMREVSFGQDGHYSHQAIANRCNADLSNDLGNLAQRTLTMAFKFCDGSIPVNNGFNEDDKDLLEKTYNLKAKIVECMERYEPHLALSAAWKVIGEANKYFSCQEAWVLRKTDPKRMQTVLYVGCEVLRVFAILLYPFIPQACEKMFGILGVDEKKRFYDAVSLDNRVVSGLKLEAPKPLFPRVEIK